MAISIPNVGFILLTGFMWLLIHATLEEKNIELFQSRIWMSELPPAVIFSFSFIYYLIPTGYQLITGNLPNYVTTGPFFPIMQFVGAIIFTASSVTWLSLLSDEQKEIEDVRSDVDDILSKLHGIPSDSVSIDNIDTSGVEPEDGEAEPQDEDGEAEPQNK